MDPTRRKLRLKKQTLRSLHPTSAALVHGGGERKDQILSEAGTCGSCAGTCEDCEPTAQAGCGATDSCYCTVETGCNTECGTSCVEYCSVYFESQCVWC